MEQSVNYSLEYNQLGHILSDLGSNIHVVQIHPMNGPASHVLLIFWSDKKIFYIICVIAWRVHSATSSKRSGSAVDQQLKYRLNHADHMLDPNMTDRT